MNELTLELQLFGLTCKLAKPLHGPLHHGTVQALPAPVELYLFHQIASCPRYSTVIKYITNHDPMATTLVNCSNVLLLTGALNEELDCVYSTGTVMLHYINVDWL